MKSFIITLLLPVCCISQQQKPLSVGDTFPAAAWQHLQKNLPSLTPLRVERGSGGEAKEGPGVRFILDFFATWCTACIRELPKLDSMQKQFGARLQIVLVAQESAEKLEAFRKKNKLFANCQLPVISGDSALKKLFPHKYLPHEVWINQDGKIDAITDALYVDEQNITQWLSGKKPSLPLKADAMDFNLKKPLLQNGNGGTEELILCRSMLTRRLKGMGGSEGRVTENNNTRWYYINATVLSLYKKALGFPSNRIILEVADTSRYILPSRPHEEWKDANIYSYEITAPSNIPKDSINRFMWQDLNRFLGLHGRMEIREVNCWALTGDSGRVNKLKTKTAKPVITEDQQTRGLIFKNQSLSSIVAALNSANTPAPGKPIIVDETGMNINIDISVPEIALNDIEQLQKYLSSFGFSLLPVKRKLEMFILTEPNYKP